MRKGLNKKGFTLIELLAVIVVLAVIMVIATQQVNRAIKKSRGEAFLETVQSVRKSMQTVCAMDNKITTETLEAELDNAEAITVTVTPDAEGDVGTVKVTANGGGKFINRLDPDESELPSGISKVEDTGSQGNSYTFKTECPAS